MNKSNRGRWGKIQKKDIGKIQQKEKGGGKGNENKKMTKQRNKCGRRNVKVKTRM